MVILGVDPGAKRIGIAVSDPTGVLARPLKVLLHSSRTADALAIVQSVEETGASSIVVGFSADENGNPNLAGKRSIRLADELRSLTQIPVELWDESLSTQDARTSRLASGISRKRRAAAIDADAAAIILQSYLESRHNDGHRGFER